MVFSFLLFHRRDYYDQVYGTFLFASINKLFVTQPHHAQPKSFWILSGDTITANIVFILINAAYNNTFCFLQALQILMHPKWLVFAS